MLQSLYITICSESQAGQCFLVQTNQAKCFSHCSNGNTQRIVGSEKWTFSAPRVHISLGWPSSLVKSLQELTELTAKRLNFRQFWGLRTPIIFLYVHVLRIWRFVWAKKSGLTDVLVYFQGLHLKGQGDIRIQKVTIDRISDASSFDNSWQASKVPTSKVSRSNVTFQHMYHHVLHMLHLKGRTFQQKLRESSWRPASGSKRENRTSPTGYFLTIYLRVKTPRCGPLILVG